MSPSPTSLTPPRFVNLAARAVYGDLPAPLFQSYARLAGLTWNQTDKATLPPLTLGELSIVLGCRERQTWEHLHALRRAGWLEWTQSDSRLCIRLTQPPLQTFATAGEGDDDDERPMTKDDCVSSSSPLSVPLQNFATKLAVLAEFGVDRTDAEARAVAQLPHVTPDLIRAWAVELQHTPKVKQLPRLLLHKLRYTWQFPKREEHRGGARSRQATSPKDEAKNATCVALPAEVLAALKELGWTDDLAEVQAHFTQDPQRVRAWLEHARTSKTAASRAGLFRWGLRQAARYPPQADTPLPKNSSPSKYHDDNDLFNEPMSQ